MTPSPSGCTERVLSLGRQRLMALERETDARAVGGLVYADGLKQVWLSRAAQEVVPFGRSIATTSTSKHTSAAHNALTPS